jgi:hypothetical protein
MPEVVLAGVESEGGVLATVAQLRREDCLGEGLMASGIFTGGGSGWLAEPLLLDFDDRLGGILMCFNGFLRSGVV